jgi:hypothetical protein
MSKIECFNTKNRAESECFITPVVTLSGKKFLIITKHVERNWYESVKDIEGIISYLSKKYNFHPGEYIMILHAFFHSIDLEQFYRINPGSKDLLGKLTIGELEKMLV